ncbi:MAG: pyrimidine 5'-nucleotidase [Chloroflexi bacterium]|nr:pyrimidine 5'-nucleotidase [Chloroflexota bacterium]
MYDLILFDLDDTLYPRSAGLMNQIGERITQYLVERMGVPPERSAATRSHFRGTYGTALRGLMEEGYPVDLEDYFRYVHDIPLGTIGPTPVLHERLLRLPLRRAVLTNSNFEHASRVLGHMEIADCFERVVDIRALEFVNKPDPEAYRRTLAMLGGAPERTIFVEDNTVNTRPARAMGMLTIVIDHPLDPEPDRGADYSVPDLNAALDLIEHIVTGMPS